MALIFESITIDGMTIKTGESYHVSSDELLGTYRLETLMAVSAPNSAGVEVRAEIAVPVIKQGFEVDHTSVEVSIDDLYEI